MNSMISQTEIKINIEKDWDRAMNDPCPGDESLIDEGS